MRRHGMVKLAFGSSRAHIGGPASCGAKLGISAKSWLMRLRELDMCFSKKLRVHRTTLRHGASDRLRRASPRHYIHQQDAHDVVSRSSLLELALYAAILSQWLLCLPSQRRCSASQAPLPLPTILLYLMTKQRLCSNAWHTMLRMVSARYSS